MNRLLNDLTDNFKKENNGLIQLILINVVVFVLFSIIEVISKLTNTGAVMGFIDRNIYLHANLHEFIRTPWTLLTYSFAHSLRDIFHIIFNMLGLYWFGRVVQDLIGSRRLINIYIIGAIAGGATFLLLLNTVPYFMSRPDWGYPLLGASGAVFAIAVAAATLVPDHTFFLLFIGPVRIIYIVSFYIFISFIGSVNANAGGNICHLGGAALGFSYIYLLRKGVDLGQPINFIVNKIKNIRSSKLKVTYRKTDDNNVSQNEIDTILDKISRSGYNSLSKEEKQKLFKASQK